MKEVVKMRLPKSRLASQQRNTERPTLYPAQQFQPESLVHLREILVWIIRHQQ